MGIATLKYFCHVTIVLSNSQYQSTCGKTSMYMYMAFTFGLAHAVSGYTAGQAPAPAAA